MADTNNEIFPVDEDDTDVMVTIDLDDGGELDCEIVVIFEMDSQDYIALMPVDENGKQLEDYGILHYRYYETDDGTPVIDNIESDEELEKVTEAFNSLLDE